MYVQIDEIKKGENETEKKKKKKTQQHEHSHLPINKHNATRASTFT